VKQILQNFKTGAIEIAEIPKPALRAGCVLVRNNASAISTGTEGSTVKLGKMSLIGKARARPEQVKKVLQALRTEGVIATLNAVNRTLDLPIPLGYSCAGIVEEVGDGVADLEPGAPVACAGAGMAYHAEYVVVPRNLCASIPEGVSFDHAAFTTLGSIAMQGVRICGSRLGDNVVVIGLGLVGLLTVQILKASGCRVFGIDINSQRIEWVNRIGLCTAALRSADNLHERILKFSGGYGADCVIIAAAVPSNDPVVLAGEIARYKGRVVVVGRTVMEAPRETYLFKELELSTSYAYGPGTGDPTYEMDGYDYPIGYVRWTENRNMQCFLSLVADGRMDLSSLITHAFPIDQALHAFDMVSRSDQSVIGVVIRYHDAGQIQLPSAAPPSSVSVLGSTTQPPLSAPPEPHPIRVGIIGAGSFATNIMIPLLAQHRDLDLRAIASSTGVKAAAIAKKYHIPVCTAQAHEILESADIDCVFILTRHGTHAAFAERALRAGKHVFVEKPLALNENSLRGVCEAQALSGKVLMVGFNRRFSPLAIKLKDFFTDRCQPMIVEFRGNVGYRPPEHWLHHPTDGGGVILGEACHYIDFCRWLIDSPVRNIDVRATGGRGTGLIPEDNVAILINFEDGSIADVLYSSNGAPRIGRERCEVHSEGKSAIWEDFKYLKLVRGLRFPRVTLNPLFRKKGYEQELAAFFNEISRPLSLKIDWLSSQIDASLASILASKELFS